MLILAEEICKAARDTDDYPETEDSRTLEIVCVWVNAA